MEPTSLFNPVRAAWGGVTKAIRKWLDSDVRPRCPACGKGRVGVTETRDMRGYIAHYGKCDNCKQLYMMSLTATGPRLHQMVNEIPVDRRRVPAPTRRRTGPHDWMGR
jgi:hypothetical protein